jgi:hypothetical protein
MVGGVDIGRQEQFRRMRSRLGVRDSRCLPAVCRKKMANIGLSRDIDIMLGLQNILAVKRGDETLLVKRRRVFARELKVMANFIIDLGGNCWIRRSGGKIINLAKKENLHTVNLVGIDVPLVGGGF